MGNSLISNHRRRLPRTTDTPRTVTTFLTPRPGSTPDTDRRTGHPTGALGVGPVE